MTELDINFLAHQLERALTETAALRADMAVLTATTAAAREHNGCRPARTAGDEPPQE
jgi:hypothetical protein